MVFPNKYKCLDIPSLQYLSWSIYPIRYEDRLSILKWRNDQIDILRQEKPLTLADQDVYFKNTVYALFHQTNPKQILFSFFYQKKLIGYGGLVHIDWKSKNAEISFLLDSNINTPSLYHSYFSAFLKMLYIIAKNQELVKIYTFGYNTEEYRFEPLIELGYKKEAELKRHRRINDRWVNALIYAKEL